MGSVYEFNNRTEDHENRTRASKPTSIGQLMDNVMGESEA